VPPRATTEALIRLRQAGEQEAMRALRRARDAVERAQSARERAVAAQGALTERMQRLNAASARTAGALGLRDAYRAQLRAQLDGASERAQATARALREATQALGGAQRQVEQALRAREAAEAQRDADDKAEGRRRERRDQTASDDRWRPPRRRS
jgi:colicin import membrane protein